MLITYRNIYEDNDSTLLVKKDSQYINIYQILLNGEKVGSFSIKLIGDVELDPLCHFKLGSNVKIFKNSILFSGGFAILYNKRKQGIGRNVIKTIFDNNPKIENIFLYALQWQGAFDFWEKIGGEIILDSRPNRELAYFQIDRHKLKIK